VDSAHRALAEIRARDATDAVAEQDHRVEQLAQWHEHDQVAEHVGDEGANTDKPDLVDAHQP
jgi:hypothetical protein